MSRLEHTFRSEFATTPDLPWRTLDSGHHAGTARAAGLGAGNVTFVRVFEAGYVRRDRDEFLATHCRVCKL